MPIPLAVPIVGGVVAVGALALRAHAVAKQKANAAAVAAIKIPTQTNPGAPIPVLVTKAQLDPAVQTVLKTRGPELNQTAINALAIEQAAGTLDVANLLKGTDGSLFTKTSPQMAGLTIGDDMASSIIPTDSITVDVLGAGFQIPAIPSGNMLMKVITAANMAARTLTAVSVDPRVPDGGPILTIPINAITGVSPAGTFTD